MAKRRVLFVSSECTPYAKTGGLGDVIGALPKALARRGLDVRVMLPLYAGFPWDELEILEGILEVPVGHWVERAGVRLGSLPGSAVPVYFLEHLRYFDRRGIYGDGEAYGDNLERFAFFSRGALSLCRALGWSPDIVHAHDWPAALAPVYVDSLERPAFPRTASVLTIHNTAHQGVFGRESFPLAGFSWGQWDPARFEHDGALNLLKAGIQTSTRLTTVSPTYAGEIQTPELGAGLDGVIRGRARDLSGILNGIDVEVWDPTSDPHLAATYSAADLTGKAACKTALQREMGLPVRPEVPVFGIIARLDPQKGLDVVLSALERILALDLQLVLLGSGAADLEHGFRHAAAAHPDKVAVRIGFSVPLSHRIEAGSDFFLMPSRFEPCGLNQLYSLRYGTLPVVRATGGLIDTVQSYDEATGAGTGFSFKDLHPQAVFDVVGWAVWTWYERHEHIELMRRRAMEQDFSWDRSAETYARLYEAALHAIGAGAPGGA